jgi:hypothetical protein
MSDDTTPNEIDDLVDAWIRDHPEIWDAAYPKPTGADIDGDVDRVVARARSIADAPNARRRRRRSIGAVVVGTFVIVGGSVGVAALLRSGQPSQPAQGISCRASEDTRADAIVIPPSVDPIAACAEQWAAGSLGPTQEVPPLTVCIATTGVVEVYPGDTQVCGRLGLATADPELTPDNLAVLSLNDLLVEEVNLADCAPAVDVQLAAQRIVDDLGLDGWTVKIRDDSQDADCAKVALDQPTKTITVIKFP